LIDVPPPESDCCLLTESEKAIVATVAILAKVYTSKIACEKAVERSKEIISNSWKLLKAEF
jgi:hypothetical protein